MSEIAAGSGPQAHKHIFVHLFLCVLRRQTGRQRALAMNMQEEHIPQLFLENI